MWQQEQTTIKALNQFRDIGAHINTTTATNSSTLNNRADTAANAIARIDGLPLSAKQKTHQIRTRGLPKALDGCEVAKLAEKATKALDNDDKEFHQQENKA